MLFVVFLSLKLLMVVETASGQDKGKLAVVLGGSNFGGTGTGSLGGLWQFSNRFAVRPEFTISHVDNRFNFGSADQHTTTTNTGYGVSGLITVHKINSLRLYVSPRFAYAKSASNTTLTPSGGVGGGLGGALPGGSLGNVTSSYDVSGPYSGRVSFGGQYALNHHFSIFGESGVEDVLMQTPEGQTQYTSLTKQSTWQTVTTFGLLLYFR